MAKIKIVQIAIGTDDYPSEYLFDDKGRVWYRRAFSGYEWKQIDLPEEPND